MSRRRLRGQKSGGASGAARHPLIKDDGVEEFFISQSGGNSCAAAREANISR